MNPDFLRDWFLEVLTFPSPWITDRREVIQIASKKYPFVRTGSHKKNESRLQEGLVFKCIDFPPPWITYRREVIHISRQKYPSVRTDSHKKNESRLQEGLVFRCIEFPLTPDHRPKGGNPDIMSKVPFCKN